MYFQFYIIKTAKNILGILENLELNKKRLESNNKKDHISQEKN